MNTATTAPTILLLLLLACAPAAAPKIYSDVLETVIVISLLCTYMFCTIVSVFNKIKCEALPYHILFNHAALTRQSSIYL